MLKMMTKKGDPKIKVLLFLENEPKNDVMKDVSVSVRPI